MVVGIRLKYIVNIKLLLFSYILIDYYKTASAFCDRYRKGLELEPSKNHFIAITNLKMKAINCVYLF